MRIDWIIVRKTVGWLMLSPAICLIGVAVFAGLAAVVSSLWSWEVENNFFGLKILGGFFGMVAWMVAGLLLTGKVKLE